MLPQLDELAPRIGQTIDEDDSASSIVLVAIRLGRHATTMMIASFEASGCGACVAYLPRPIGWICLPAPRGWANVATARATCSERPGRVAVSRRRDQCRRRWQEWHPNRPGTFVPGR